MPDDYPQAVVREVDGHLVLEDPVALEVMQAVDDHNRGIAKQNCRLTFDDQAERVAHFSRRIAERGESPKNVVIVLLNVDDKHGGVLADVLMPNNEAAWQVMRDQGMTPFARGLAQRPGIEGIVTAIDPEVGARLKALQGTAVVVMHHGVVEVFETETFQPKMGPDFEP
jgi:hypothetical protein